MTAFDTSTHAVPLCLARSQQPESMLAAAARPALRMTRQVVPRGVRSMHVDNVVGNNTPFSASSLLLPRSKPPLQAGRRRMRDR